MSVALAAAIRAAMDARGLRVAEVARRMVARGDNPRERATIYRLLSAMPPDPRVGTFITLCAALETHPTKLLQMAGLWPRRKRPTDATDLMLRAVLAGMRELSADDKRRVAPFVALIAETYGGDDDGHAEHVISQAS